MEEKNQQQPAAEPASGASSSPAALQKKFPTPGDVFAMLGIALGAQIVVGVVVVVVSLLTGNGANVAGLEQQIQGRVTAVIYLVTMSLALFGILYYRKVRGGSGPVAQFSARGLNPILLLWAFVLMLVAGVVLEPVVSLLPDPPYEALGRGFWTLISLAVLAPVFEEIICRGIVLGSLRAKYGPTVALLVSALFFGILHVHPAQVIGAGVLGLVLGYIYIATGSLWAPIILHAANNSVAYLLLVSGIGDKNLSEIVSGPVYMVIYMLALAVCAVSVYMIWKSLKEMKEKEKNRA